MNIQTTAGQTAQSFDTSIRSGTHGYCWSCKKIKPMDEMGHMDYDPDLGHSTLNGECIECFDRYAEEDIDVTPAMYYDPLFDDPNEFGFAFEEEEEEEPTLLEETVAVLARNGKTPQDVKWCGSYEYGWFTWEEFAKVAIVHYDSGYGAAEIATDLVIVGNNWWLERGEYDGSEWWEYKTMPKKGKKVSVTTVKNRDMWATLTEMNRPGGKYSD